MARRSLLLVLLLPACVSPRPAVDAAEQLEPPATWQAGLAEGDAHPAEAGADALAEDWWVDFDSPGLAAAVEEALGANWDLAGAGFRVTAAAAEARIATGSRWPALDAGLDLSRSRRNFIGLPVPGAENGILAVESDSHALSFQLSWEADLWGRLAAGERAAIRSYQAAEADWNAARLSLAGLATKAWFALGTAERRLSLAQEGVELARSRLDLARAHFRAGRGSAGQVHSTETALAGAEQVAQAAVQELQASSRALELLLGRYPAGRTRSEELAGLPPPVPAGLPADLVSRRPDLQAADARLRAELARADQAEASLYPRLSLTASGGTSTVELSDLLNGDFKVWGLAAGLTAPLFHGDQLRAGLEVSEAVADAAQASFLQATLAAYGDVEGALLGERLLRERLALADQAQAQARAGGRAAERRFGSGLASATVLLDAREAIRQTRTARLEVHLALLLNRVDLYLALGGGFSAEIR